ncbi:MAG TPA: TauD/TfdA family dioxygenase [Caulobacteraceae bacterium]|jgi:taurine dioxygenase
MAKPHFNVRMLAPRIGAEVLDVDVNALTDAEFAEIRRLWVENLVIFFRDQNMTPAQHVAFGKRFGDLRVSHNPRIHHPEHPEIAVMLNDENSKNAVGDLWHTDGSGDPEPPSASMLYMHEIPPNGGGDTLFASTQLAYDTLSDSLKAYLETLTAIHDRQHVMRGQTGIYAQQLGDGAPVTEHPVIRTHPESGKKGVYVNRGWTTHIVQLKKPESDAVLAFLFEHIEQPLNQCRFKWQPGSIALWDNRSAHHLALWDYHPHRRLAHRIMVAGDRPYLHAPAAKSANAA